MKDLNLKDLELFESNAPIENLKRVDHLFLGGKIENEKQINFLREEGVSLAVDLKGSHETPFMDQEYFEKFGIQYFHFPVKNLECLDFHLLSKVTSLLKNREKKH